MQILSPKAAIDRFGICSSNYIDFTTKFVIPDPEYTIKIGKNNVIYPGCVIFAASGYRENTVIGNNNHIGTGCTISSDAYIGNNNSLISNCYVGRFVSILNYTKIEASVAITDYSTVGSFSQIGALTPVVKDVSPFSKVFGNPAALKGFVSGKALSSFSAEQFEQIKQYVINNIMPTDINLISIIDDYNNHSRKKQTK